MTSKHRDFAPTETERNLPGVGRRRPEAAKGQTLTQGLRALGIEHLGGTPLDLPSLEIGERIRHARHLRGLTQAQLASKIGCKQGDLSDIERGKGRDGPSYRTLKSVADALGVALPINPGISSETGRAVVVEAGEGDCVVSGVGQYETCKWIFSRDELIGLRSYVGRVGAGVEANTRRFTIMPTECTLLTLPPSSKAKAFKAGAFTVLVALRGDAHVRVRGAVHRRSGFAAGKPVALLSADSFVEVESGDMTSSMIFMPATTLFGHDTEDCEA